MSGLRGLAGKADGFNWHTGISIEPKIIQSFGLIWVLIDKK